MTDSFKARSTLKVGDRSYEIWRLDALPKDKVARLPYSLKILLENLLRFEDGVNVTRPTSKRCSTGIRRRPRPTKSRSRRRASSFRTSPACPASSTSQRCAMRSCGSAATPSR